MGKDVEINTFHATVPSKTFLIGEYAVLWEGCGILFATAPRFELFAERVKEPQAYPEMPLLESMLSQDESLRYYKYRFVDPHGGQGGFGASSALVLMLLLLQACQRNSELRIEDVDLEEFTRAIRRLTWSGHGIKPSGADLVAQWLGQVCIFERKPNVASRSYWPFSQLGMMIIRTREKVRSHDHLRQLNMDSQSELVDLAQQAVAALEAGNADDMVDCVNMYQDMLERLGLMMPVSSGLCRRIMSCPGVLAAKGCGAMGADAVVVLYDNRSYQTVRAWVVERLNRPIIASADDFSPGIDWQCGM